MANLPLFLRVVRDGKPLEMKQVAGEQVVIGRMGDVTLAVNDPKTGPIHCMIENRDGRYFLCDLGTEYGTFYKGDKIVETEIKSGEEFKIGDTTIEFHVGVPKPYKASGSANTVLVPPAPVKAPAPTPAPLPPKTKPIPVVTTAKAPPPARSMGTGITIAAPGTPRMPPLKKGTFAPPSSPKVRDNLKPSQGTVVEVVLFWKDRVLATNHYSHQKIVKIGSHPDNDIILPIFGSIRLSHPLLKIENVAQVFVTSDMTGEVVKKDGSKVSFLDLKRNNSMQPNGALFSYQIQQNELIRIQIGEGVEIAIRYVGSVPQTRLAPMLDLSVNQITALIIMFLGTFLFLFYVFVYAPPAPEKVEEETIPPRKAQFFYKAPPEELKPIEVSPEPQVAKSNQAPIKDKEVAPERGEEGAAQEAKPNNSKSNKQILTADKAGKDKGIQKAVTNNKPNAAPVKPAKDVTKSGLLSVFGTKGMQDQLNKASAASGNVAGLSQGAKGQGGEAAGAGVVAGAGLKEIGMGGNGTATVGIKGPKTKGRGGGLDGYGTAGLGAKKNATILSGDNEFTSTGTIDRDAIRRVVQANLKQIKACYEKGLNRDPSLYGKMVIQWTIGAGGIVKTASIKSTTLNNTEVEQCSVARLKTWKFPDPPVNEEAVVSYPFVLQGQE